MSLSLEAGEGAESSGETRNASSQGLLTRSSQLIAARSSSSPSLTGCGGGGWALDILLPKAFLLRPWGGLKKAHTQEAKEVGSARVQTRVLSLFCGFLAMGLVPSRFTPLN